MGIEIGGNATGAVFRGDKNKIGDITIGGRPADDRSAQVRAMLAALRAEVAAKPDDAEGKDVALVVLDDLDEELARDQPRRDDVEKKARKVSERVTGGLAAGASVAVLVEKVVGLFG